MTPFVWMRSHHWAMREKQCRPNASEMTRQKILRTIL
jgi:hypothetical protein